EINVTCATLPSMSSRRPTVIDLFAGAGLLSHAFREERFSVEYAIELDAAAARTYAANLGPHIRVADVRRVKPTGRFDVLVAAPPCHGFSGLGKRDSDDPRNLLSLEVVRWAKYTRPRVVVIENVARFVGSSVWTRLTAALRRLGYEITAIELNAVDFGA